MTELPFLESSRSLQEMKPLFETILSDEITVTRGQRGSVGARTRLRVHLAQLAKLCKEARKEIPPRPE